MPSLMVAVDPGIRGCGVAKFRGGVLVEAAYVKNPVASGGGAGPAECMARAVATWVGAVPVDLLVVEWPRVYASRIRRGESPGDPNDLLGLAAVDGAVAALLDATAVECVAPSDWKGQLPKAAMGARVRSRLLPAEVEVVDAADVIPSLLHNLLDAVGIGLHRLGRLERRRVIA